MLRSDYILLPLVLVLTFLVRLLTLDQIPSELFGDVIEHMAFVEILNKTKPDFSHWWGGDGPIYPHLAWIFFRIFGMSYWTMKLTTTIVGILIGFNVWLLTNSIFKKRLLAYIAAIICLFSFWNMSQSVAAKGHIFAAYFATLAVYFYSANRKFIAGLVLGIGMYGQAAFWGMAFFALLSPWMIVSFLLPASYFIYHSFFVNKDMFSDTAYLGSKLSVDGSSAFEELWQLSFNVYRNLKGNILALFYEGDPGFRHNVAGDPHIDVLTFAFFSLGTAFFIAWFIEILINKKNFITSKISDITQTTTLKQIFFCILIPLFLAQLASLADFGGDVWGRNISRMSGSMPFVYIIAAIGVYNVYFLIAQISRNAALIAAIIIVGVIANKNYSKFIYDYPQNLPNANTSFSKVLVAKFLTLSPETETYTIDCCWGNSGQPEPMAIHYSFPKGKEAPFVPPVQFETGDICKYGLEVRDAPKNKEISKNKLYAFASRPELTIDLKKMPCLELVNSELLVANGYHVARLFLFRGR